MTQAFICGQSRVYLVEFDSTGITLLSNRLLNSGTDGVNDSNDAAIIHPDGDRAYFEGNLFGPIKFCEADISGGTIGSIDEFNTSDQPIEAGGMAINGDGTRLVITTLWDSGASRNASIWDLTVSPPTLVTNHTFGSVSTSMNRTICLGGNRFLTTTLGAGGQYLFTIDGDTVTELASPGIEESVPGDHAGNFDTIKPNVFVSGYSSAAGRIVSVADDTFNQLATGNLSSQFVTAANNFLWQYQNLKRVDGLNITSLDTLTGLVQTVEPAVSDDGTLALFRSQTPNTELALIEWDGSAATEIDTLTLSTTIEGISRSPIPLPNQPPTPEQEFRDTFADVSGRDPLSTALSQRNPARNLCNYYIEQYLYNPQFVTKTYWIELGEFDQTAPGMMIWLKADDREPWLTQGRWAYIQGRSGNANPGPVEFEFRISDNPESFVEPT